MINVAKDSEAAQTLAEFAEGLKYDNLPDEVRQNAKRNILDTMGVTIAASTTVKACAQLVDIVKDGGGKEESTILGFGGKAPAWMAAMANGAAARALCYDDAHDEGHTHPSSTSVSSSLAIAERIGKVSGKQLITAVALSNEVICRMALSVCIGRGQRDWFLATVHGVFGGAAACGNLLGLGAKQIQDAFGIALFNSAGTREGLTPGSTATILGMAIGLTANTAVMSSLMAQRGITGIKNSLEGPFGLFKVYFQREYDRRVLLDDLGQHFESARVSIKPWPAVRVFHGYIEAALGILGENQVYSEDIRQIAVFSKRPMQRLEDPPATTDLAVRSLPYLLGVAALRRSINVRDVVQGALNDPEVIELARKVVPELDKQFNVTDKMGPGKVRIDLNSGKYYLKEVGVAHGDPDNPMSSQEVNEKFRDCASYSARSLSKQDVEKVVRMINNLEDIEDVREITRLLA
jgi:2-methylcitrate dehydratase PrpD